MAIIKTIRTNHKFASLLLGIIITGFLITLWVGRSADIELRKEHLNQAKLVAPAININRVRTLTGTSADLSSADYIRLKEQLELIRSADKEFRFIYLLGKNNEGNLFFFVDNESPDSKDYSPPGQIYEDASDELKDIFNSKKAIVEGPEPDEWGVWVSTLTPLIDPESGKVIAVMGMDIDARDWKLNVASRSAMPMIMVLIIVIMLLIWANGRRIEIKLKENEEKYRRFFDTSLDCTFISSRDGTIIDANDVSLSLFGYPSRDELFKTNIINLYSKVEDREAFINILNEKGHAKEYPVELKKKDGTILHCIVTAVLLKGPIGEITGIQGTVRDISEKKKNEEQLQQKEATLSAITNSTKNAILMMDPEGKISFWNPAAEKILGWSESEAIGKNLHSLIAPSRFHEAHHKAFSHFSMSGQGAAIGKTIELSATCKNGTEIPVELSLSAVNIKDRWHAVAIMRDITERKNNENEIRKTNEQLSIMVHQLEAQHLRSKLMTEMREFLQACSTTLETGPVLEQSMKKLFPDSDGALFLLSPSKTDLESIARWGNYPESMDENVISLDECWGLRRGSLYLADKNHGDILCSHIKHHTGGTYACLPLMAKGEVLGLLHLRSKSEHDNQKFIEELKDGSTALVELLALAISNIKLREKLSIQSIKDPLTGLFNRRYLEETFIREATRARRKQAPIGVIMADIDHFKKFNDVFGHAAGDMVLAELAKFFTSNLRGCDIVCRYGGEEFALVLPDANLENTFMRATHLVEQVRTLRLHFNGQALGEITLSMGVSAYPVHGEKLEDILRIADLALYRAKQEGRNRVIVPETINI